MYSQRIIQSNIERYERAERSRRSKLGLPRADKFRLIRFPSDVIEEMVEHLDKLVDKKTGQFTRDLIEHEQAFIDNELAVCQLDVRYLCENYLMIQLASQSDRPAGWDEADADDPDKLGSGARLGKFLLNGMQLQLLKKLAKLEEACYEALARGAPVNGILLILHKARQLGASLFWQALMFHRVNFYSHINALTASIDAKSTQALFRRFERMYDHLPIWMQAKKKRQTVDGGIEFERGSLIDLQSGEQKKDLGKGETWHAVHITEVASFANPDRHFDEGLFPAIPQSLYTLYGMESTSDGKSGWWYDFVTAVMSGTAEGGAGRFDHYFAPFYLIDMMDESRGQRSKYRIEAHQDWQPAISTKMMALRVKATSHLYSDIESLELHRDVLYWYERTRAYYQKRGKLNFFLQSFPVDADESFQHAGGGAFTNETIARLKDNVERYEPWPYELTSESEREDRAAIGEPLQIIGSDDHPVLRINQHILRPLHRDEIDIRDVRGIIFLWEQPDERYLYSLGADPPGAGGITGWRPAFKQHNDIGIDNGAIEIFRRGKPPIPCDDCGARGFNKTSVEGVVAECRTCDGRGKIGGRVVQVAEFAAPVDPEDLALYIWVLGKLFRGNSELDECLAVVENNSVGIITIRKLQAQYGYVNLYQAQSVGAEQTPRLTNGVGFASTPITVPILHARSRSIIVRRDVEVRSRFLVKEYSDAVVKISGADSDGNSTSIIVRERFVVPAGGGRHDDRMIASFLALLGLFDWTEAGNSLDDGGYESPERRMLPDLTRRDVSADEQSRQWNDLAAEYLGDSFEDLMLGGHYPDCAFDCKGEHVEPEDEEAEWWEDEERERFGEFEYEEF